MARKKPDMEKLRAFVRSKSQSWLDQDNITSVGIGFKEKDGKPTNEIAIQFTVETKLTPEALAAESIDPLPKSFEIDGVEVPTDILERTYKPSYKVVAEAPKDPRKSRLDPIMPGVSVGHPKVTAGTFGCVVYDRNDGALYMLSNWHVLNGPGGKIGDTIVQPGAFDDNRVHLNASGRLKRSHLGSAGDCAIATIEGRGVGTKILDLGVAVEELGRAELGDKVIKSGRTTAVTRGIVTRVDVTVRLDYGLAEPARIGGFEITPDAAFPPKNGEISMGGDSGSAWMAIAKNGKPSKVMLGLHFAGEANDSQPEHAMACYAHAVFDKLEITPKPPVTVTLAPAGLGYAVNFLGAPAPVPTMSAKVNRDAFKNGGDAEIRHTHFSLAVSKSRRMPFWVAWNIDGMQLKAFGRKGLSFKFDPDVPAEFQAGDDIYSGNKLDRGHIARRDDLVWGPPEEAQKANKESFYFTNITPQHEKFNQSKVGGLWGRLEEAIMKDVEAENLRVSVISGPVFRSDDVEYREIQIPRDFWKIVLYSDAATKKLVAKGFLLTQDDLLNQIEALGLEEFRMYRIPISDLEKRTGLGFEAIKKAEAPAEAEAVVEVVAPPRRGVMEILSEEDLVRA